MFPVDMRESTARDISLGQQNKSGHERRELRKTERGRGEREQSGAEDRETPCSQMAEVGSEAGEGKGMAGEVQCMGEVTSAEKSHRY